MTFAGVHWRELEQLVRPKPSARYAIAHAEQGFTANVPISFLARRARAARDARERRAARARARLAAAARHPGQVLLEEREVAARDRALGDRQAGLLGALRLPQRRRPVRGGALRLLRVRTTTRSGDFSGSATAADTWATHLPRFTPRRPRPPPRSSLLLTERRRAGAQPALRRRAEARGAPYIIPPMPPMPGMPATGAGLLGRLGDDRLGGEDVLRDRRSVLQRRARDHRRVDDPALRRDPRSRPCRRSGPGPSWRPRTLSTTTEPSRPAL